MGGIGIVNNPRSRRNRRRPRIGARLRAMVGADGDVLDASTLDELARAVERFRAADIDLLGINGGDGTAHVVLTAIVRAWGGRPLPRLLLLRGGAMNTVAHGHHIHGTPERVLHEVLARRRRGEPLRTVDRDLLRIRADGGEPVYGFIFGTGAVVAFLERYYASPSPSPLTAAALVARGVLSAFVRGPFAATLTRRERLRVATDGDEWPDQAYLCLLAGATPDIGLGVKAFARCAEQPGFFHAVGVTASVLQLVPSLPRITRGAPYRRTIAHDEVARELVAEGENVRFTVDGDLYAAVRTVRVETGPGVSIVLP